MDQKTKNDVRHFVKSFSSTKKYLKKFSLPLIEFPQKKNKK